MGVKHLIFETTAGSCQTSNLAVYFDAITKTICASAETPQAAGDLQQSAKRELCGLLTMRDFNRYPHRLDSHFRAFTLVDNTSYVLEQPIGPFDQAHGLIACTNAVDMIPVAQAYVGIWKKDSYLGDYFSASIKLASILS